MEELDGRVDRLLVCARFVVSSIYDCDQLTMGKSMMVVLAVCSCVYVLWFLPSKIVITSLWERVRWSCWPIAPVCLFCGFFNLRLLSPYYRGE